MLENQTVGIICFKLLNVSRQLLLLSSLKGENKKKNSTQKGYLISSGTELVHAGVSVQTHVIWLRSMSLLTDMRERERERIVGKYY